MSVRVELDGLWERIGAFGERAYLVTVTPEPGDPDDHLVRTKLTKAQLSALPDWKG